MKTRTILIFSLLAIVLLIGCTTTAPAETQPALMENEPEVTSLAMSTASQPEATPTEAPAEEAPPTEVPQVVATSRGPDLEATDPSTYTRASGDLQLVEFFAFW